MKKVISNVTKSADDSISTDVDSETITRLKTAAALSDESINLSDPDAPEVQDWAGATRGRFYKPIKV